MEGLLRLRHLPVERSLTWSDLQGLRERDLRVLDLRFLEALDLRFLEGLALDFLEALALSFLEGLLRLRHLPVERSLTWSDLQGLRERDLREGFLRDFSSCNFTPSFLSLARRDDFLRPLNLTLFSLANFWRCAKVTSLRAFDFLEGLLRVFTILYYTTRKLKQKV